MFRSAIGVTEAILLVPALLFTGYLLVLTILAAAKRTERRFAAGTQRKFAFVIPAYNEEAGIAGTVRSALAVDYPRDRFDVVVIADNCTDDTAGRARDAGAGVIERRDPVSRGKGQALRWGFDRLLGAGAGYDAIVVVDADSVVTPNYLSVMNWYVDQGARAIQSLDLVAPGNDAWNARMTQIGFLLYNCVRPLGRTMLGGSAGLRGNGMCFTAELLARVPWKAFSVAEDLEYGLQLLLEGINVAFAREATVFATMPADERNAVAQRARWEGGRLDLIRRYVPLLARRLFVSPTLACCDAFFDLVTPALVNLIGGIVLATVCSFLLWVWGIGAGSYAALWVLALLMGFTHLIAGLRIARADADVYRAIAFLPRYVLWKLGVYVGMPGQWSRETWTRTTREVR